MVTCVGRLAREKNLELLLGAFEAIRRSVPCARLVLVGAGPLQDELQTRAPDAVFAGQRRDDDLAAHYASADLFLFPSMSETFGNVTTEALASGLPVVAFDHAAAAQLIIDGEQGVCVPFGDAQSFVKASVALAVDATRRERFSRAARARALELDWDSIVHRFESVLAAAIRHTAAPGNLPTTEMAQRAA